jgi:outer membrane protein OmpA-like peptidoglycan-associated protein
VKKIVLFYFILTLPIAIFSQTKIKSFYFENDQSIPTPYSQNQLELFKQSLIKEEVVILEIYSYTDSLGSNCNST